MRFVDDDTVVYLPIAETKDDVLPSDRVGTLDDLAGNPGATPPLTVPAVVQVDGVLARQFGTDEGLEASGDDADRLTRDVTIEVRAKLETSADGTYVLCCRGLGGSAAQRRLFGLQVVIVGGLAHLQMLWEEQSGVAATVPARPFVMPPGLVHFSAARRWVSLSEVEVSYAVNGEDIGTVTSSDGDIGGGTGGFLTVGCFFDGAGGNDYELFWQGPIAWVRISSVPRSVEERRHPYLLEGVFKARAYDLLRGLQPPGKALTQAPDSINQRFLMNEAAALAEAMSVLAEFDDDFHPDRAWSKLADWENLLQLYPGARDSIDARRRRLLDHRRTKHGYSVAKVKLALQRTLDLDTASIEIVEDDKLTEDDFATAIGDAWVQRAGNGTLTIVAGELELALPSGAHGQFATKDFPHLAQPLDGRPLMDGDPAFGMDATVKVASESLAAAGVGGGILVADNTDHHPLTEAWKHEAVFYGLYNDGGTKKIIWRAFTDGAWGGINVVETPAPALPRWLRMRYDGGGNFRLFRSGTGPDDAATFVDISTVTVGRNAYVGPAVLSWTESPLSPSEIHVDDWRLWQPRSFGAYRWHAYRDPALSGSPDMDGADRVVQRLKPAYTEGHAVASKVLLCDAANNGCDRTPMGA